MNKQQITEQFTKDLNDLLLKYGATLSAEDHFTGYAECGEDIRMTVDIPGIYDGATGEAIREWTEIDLGNYVAPKRHA